MRRLREEHGITSVVVATCMIALFGAAMLTIDAGQMWGTRRAVITGTDAAVLDAAQQFNMGMASPCDQPGRDAAEAHATNVLTLNRTSALHNPTDTPDGFEVTLSDPSLCATASYIPGKVRYDAVLPSQGFFSRIFGFDDSRPISSSTAAWGYITAIGRGLRPMAICDKTSNYSNYVQYWNGQHGITPSITEDQFDALYGSDWFQADGVTVNPDSIYPKFSNNFPHGDTRPKPSNKSNPNADLQYGDPNTYGSPYHPVHRIRMPDPQCGVVGGSRDWIDFGGPGSGTIGASTLASWILSGYPGSVALEPHDCNPSDGTDPQDCGSAPGDKDSLLAALHDITCPVATAAPNCQYIFPILVVNCVGNMQDGVCVQDSSGNGANTHYVQVAFLTVVLRGFGDIQSNQNVVDLDFEFVDVQTSGKVAGAPPAGAQTYQTGTQLCGADHEEGNHCPF
jgi:hypothetical protein